MNIFEFIILYFPKKENKKNPILLSFITQVKLYLNETFPEENFKFSLQPKIKKKQDYDLEDKLLYQLKIKPSHNVNILAQHILEIGKIWCNLLSLLADQPEWCDKKVDPTLGLRYIHWLIPEVLDVKVLNLDKEQRFLKIKRFYFGTLIRPNAFLSHAKVEENEHSILLSCKHYLQKFIIEFQDEMPFRIEINYCDVHRLIIDDKLDVIYLYFHLKVPVFLYFGINNFNLERVTRFGNISSTILGKSSVLKFCIPDKSTTKNIILRLIQFSNSNNKIVFCPVENVSDNKHPFPENKMLNFKNFFTYYAWLCVYSQNFQIEYQLTHSSNLSEILQTMFDYEAKNEQALQKTLYIIFEAVYQGKMVNFFKWLQVIFKFYCDTLFSEQTYKSISKIPKIVFTPSRILFLPPQLQMQNCVLRNFDSNYFLAVSLRDEDFSKLTFHIGNSPHYFQFMNETFGLRLKNGIKIYNRCYKFLAASSSQIREHKFWMHAAQSEDISADYIRKWIGFSSINGAASKKLARMGQFFSSTFEFLEITDSIEVILEPDKIKENSQDPQHPYVFTDGIGMVSSSVSQKIREKVDKFEGRSEVSSPYKTSAFQIRYQGFKGMVAENPTLIGDQIVFRESMNKFKTESNTNLAFIKTTAPRALFLNRQIITLLEQKGVKPDTFLQLQKEMIVKLVQPFIYNKEAATFLALDSHLKYPFQKLYEAGINLNEEPFFHSLITASFNEAMDLIKTKARVAIPPEFGRNLMGVLDETGKLGPGQVFVRYSEDIDKINTSKLKVLTGTVIVTKYPCIHPGDIRLLRAVDEPDLYHLIDCIAFPFRDLKRPITDEIGGGDLDGDEYAVIWHQDLLFKSSDPAMAYQRLSNAPDASDPDVNTLINFIFEYIKYDCLGMLSNSHLAFSDSEPEGIYSLKCLEIAAVYPASLDYVKSGKPVKYLNAFRTQHYPDFMEKGFDKFSYRSKRVLGDMYRDTKTLINSVKCAIFTNNICSYDQLLEYPGWEKFKDKAEQRKRMYDSKLRQIFLQQGLVENEAFLGGHGLKFLQYVDNQNMKDMEKQVFILVIAVEHLKRFMYAQFLKDICNVDQEDKLRMASSWYMVTYKQYTKETFLSFPWVLAHELIDVRQQMVKLKNCTVDFPKSSLLNKLNVPLQNRYKDITSKGSFSISEFIEYILSDWALKFEPTLERSVVEVTMKQICCDLLDNILSEDIDSSQLAFLVLDTLKNIALRKGSYLKSKQDESLIKRIQELALKTYTCFPMTKNLQYLALDLLLQEVTTTYTTVKECQAMKVHVNDHFKEFFKRKYTQIADRLKEWTGVQELQLDSEEVKGYATMIVTAKGTEIQCWDLQKILYHPKLTEALVSNDINFIKLEV